jgi:hypothetical protein
VNSIAHIPAPSDGQSGSDDFFAATGCDANTCPLAFVLAVVVVGTLGAVGATGAVGAAGAAGMALERERGVEVGALHCARSCPEAVAAALVVEDVQDDVLSVVDDGA